MSIAAGKVLSERYRLIRPVGQGSQASVWVAEHLALTTQVAVKLIDPELAKKDDARERFRREATAAAQLRSAHVVQILDHGIEGDQPFIVMELLEGEDLFERLEKRDRLTLPETSKIVTQVARALTRAHAAGIVHRDLKPENFFLVSNEDDEIVKVLDFGVAKVKNPAKHTMQRTGVGTLIGTPHYMSPEQVKGIGEVDFRTDLWALGVIVYQCVTGDLPFDSEGVGDLLIKISIGEIPIPSKRNPELPPAFDAWFARACARDASRRFSSARDLADSLARVAGLTTEVPSEVGGPRPPAALPRPTISRPPLAPSGRRGSPRSVPPAEAARSSAPPSVPRPPGPNKAAPAEPIEAIDVDDDIEAEPIAAPAKIADAQAITEELSSADLVDEPATAAPQHQPRPQPRDALESHDVQFESEAPPPMHRPPPSQPRPSRPQPAAGVPPGGIAPQPAQPRAALPVRAQPAAQRPSGPSRSLPSSTVSGLASVTPPPELDGGGRRKRLVRYFALALVALVGVVAWTVIRSQMPPEKPTPALPPPEPTVEPTPPEVPSAPPTASASAEPVEAVDPGRPPPSAAPPLPPAAPPRLVPTGAVKRPPPPPDPMTIEIPDPPDDSLPPPAP